MIAAARLNLSDTESRELQELLTEYGDIFAVKSNNYRHTDRMYHLSRYWGGPTDPPNLWRLRSKTGGCGRDAQGHAMTRGYRSQAAPCHHPVIFVRKKKGVLRFCVDCRKLNDVTRADRFPLTHWTCWSQMFLHSGPKEWLLASESTSR
jgi:hypothetical protein